MEHPGYYNTIDQIYHAEWAVAKLSRQALLRRAIATLWPQGHPTRLVQVAGTSGKGSTCRLLELGFEQVGTAGALLSPHLFDYRERFSIGGAPAARQDVTEAWEQTIKPLAIAHHLQNPQHVPSFHEIAILMALVLFDKHHVAWAAVETGVGGRYDQTTALDVVATVLTNVGSDHEHMLGSELWQRTLDKAGIARPGVPLFTSEQEPATLQIIAQVCAEVQAPLVHITPAHHAALQRLVCQVAGHSAALPPDAMLSAAHQQWNAALSLAVLQHLLPAMQQPTNEQALVERFLCARMVGRLWQVEEGIYADVAHNPSKIAALVQQIEQVWAQRGKIFVVGVSEHRSPAALLAPLIGIAKAVVVTHSSYKGQDVQQVHRDIATLRSDIPLLVVADPRQALAAAQRMRHADDLIILTGSTYMIEQALNPDPYMHWINATFGWRMRNTPP